MRDWLSRKYRCRGSRVSAWCYSESRRMRQIYYLLVPISEVNLPIVHL